MIEKIIEFSIRNRFLVIIATLAVVVWGIHSVVNTPIDAIPDLSENQVIVFTDWMGRSPREIEDQVTYPLSVNLQGLAGVKSVRSSSEFNFSMINIIFEDNIDFYFARERVSERLALASTFLPQGVTPYLAPDATALGQIFWYTVEGEGQDLGRLRAIQDWTVRYQLNSVPGVAQVASVGGYPIEYQIDVEPNKLRAYGITLGDLYAAVARSNSSVGGRVIHQGNAEYLVRGVGWIKSKRDIEQIVVKADPATGTPITVGNLATVGLGTQFRRSVLEKNGNEVVGGVVMMRHGENPLDVTQRIKQKIVELQPGLPEGVRIVAFYDRTRLIHGAIHTLTEVLTHEMIIASLAVLLILMHFRSAVVICLTLPLSVLVSFILMRHFNIPSNIMSLAGIAISIGILVDQAIVMVENATHHLTAHFGDRRVTGDIRELVIPACRTVGRPIFFSVMIILISFIPVFALSGQEGKTFHPLAFTKSFAMIGVAILSITLVPALIPTFIRGRLRREEENWLVRTLIDIYKPVLNWAMPHRNIVLWLFAVLLLLGAGLFPLNALTGFSWHASYMFVFAVVTIATVFFIDGRMWQRLSFASLVVLGFIASDFRRIGEQYMPPLDEGSILDMPVTVPRASVTEAADDLKARDAMLRQFPEVEQVVGKAGRAETPTDPAPLEMVETVVNLRPTDFWPKRLLRYEDAMAQTGVVLAALESRGLVKAPADSAARQNMINDATMAAMGRLDGTLRNFVLAKYTAFEQGLSPRLTRELITQLAEIWQRSGRLAKPLDEARIAQLTDKLYAKFGPILATGAAQENVNELVRQVAETLDHNKLVDLRDPKLMDLPRNDVQIALAALGEQLGMEPQTLFTSMLAFIQDRREQAWSEMVGKMNYEVFDEAVATYDQDCIEELRSRRRKSEVGGQGSAAGGRFNLPLPLGEGRGEGAAPSDSANNAPHPNPLPKGEGTANREAPADAIALQTLRADLDKDFARGLLLWRKSKDDLVKEMDSTIQVPGWSNIFTQPIINRIDMLATGVRTMIGVKVFGSDLNQIQAVSENVAEVLRAVPGTVAVVPDQIVGKGYLEITVDREKAARYGVNVGDVQDVIEVALGGKPITEKLENRERYPIRIRYARDARAGLEEIKNLLVTAAAGAMTGDASSAMSGMGGGPAKTPAVGSSRPLQIPLASVADVRIVEGPSEIKSENGMLRSYVQVTVNTPDLVGYVEQAQRLVDQKVKLPQGMHLEWSGQFEHKLRADRTMRIVLPLVLVLIFIILYLTYHDLMDAVLMMMAVPEALVGGVFFLWLTGHSYSVAVQVGFIACFGMATETGIIMLVYLRESLERRGGIKNIKSLEELKEAVVEGAVHRLRPKLLTEGVAIVALAPMLWTSGVGHEVISAMAAPVLGGLLVSDEVVDLFLPVRFYWVRRYRWLKLHGLTEEQAAAGNDKVTA
ncbi:MAG TPA: efflux RND transporter permease subunit [Pirellulales bacterium]|nr:efflux RND transporter permease subunit [Pirellulales bacterium]